MKFLTALLLSIALTANSARAQTLENEGVVGDMDRQSRNPHLTVGVTAGKNQVTILADAFHPSDEFKKYPIQFDFFVNRHLFATQYRSVALPGPIGVTVPSSVAKVPFNYVVVAKMLHPNSVYTTVIEGSATAESNATPPTPTPTPGATPQVPADTFDCTLTVGTGTNKIVYTASGVEITEASGVYSSSFDADSEDGLSTVSVVSTADLGATDSSTNGNVTVSEEGEADVKIVGSVDFEADGDTVKKINIASKTNQDTLACSK